ncbi:hypothetical protein JKF63_03784 [Porcisia hertigi]|uniref:Calpain catalytic domain-containing protein n=1 Tax=Porcisia hertigi TaxID=2761500 RepID=A0A836I6C3_9TRYP|nr:hypothetical protein JKF63_03784 [Porcisia hertigi]
MGCCNSKDTKNPKAPLGQGREGDLKAAPPVDPRVDRIQAVYALRKAAVYRYGACTVKGGEVQPCFKAGIVFRIIKDGSWYFYNDSLDYEAHVDVRFGPGSKISAGEHTTLEVMADGWTSAHTVVYPLETHHFVSGTPNGHKSSITIKPLSDEYRHEACAAANRVAERETDAVRSLAGDETDEEAILRMCVSTKTPYVDLSFPPNTEALARTGKDGRTIPMLAMMRPTQYLSSEKHSSVNDVVGPVVAHSIDQGNLGDSWLMCAAAIMAEEEAGIRNIFVHGTPAEKAVGAYRVLMTKNGWWRSVIVDDFVPTMSRMPVFARSFDNPAEMWVSLLQKAYAKVHGSYATITGGDTLQALADFTGMPVYRFDKDWEEAAVNELKADALVRALVEFSRAGASAVLSTPSLDSESYLGRDQARDPAAFGARYAAVGLRTGYTYFVERVVTVKTRNTTLFKVHNPWHVSGKWTGAWSYGSAEWRENPDICSVCGAESDPQDGSFWMDWRDAKKYFDGGGVMFTIPNATDYRVKGAFEGTIPSAILEITASKSTRVLLTLSQPDKRGVSFREAAALFAPIMLTVSKKDGDKQQLQKNTSWNPERPSEEFNFIVGRDVAMWFTLEAGERYQVVPRVHYKGVKSDYNRPYVMGIISETELKGNLQVEAKHLDGGSHAFTNYVTYESEELQSVETENQMRLPGKAPVTYVSTTVI